MVKIRYNSLGFPARLKDWNKFHAHHWELYPVIASCVAAGVLTVTTVVYLLSTRDIEWTKGCRKSRDLQQLLHPRVYKLMQYEQSYLANPDLAQTYMDMDKKEKELQQKK